ncbi:hypothetical protein [Shewanella sp. GXUN23E]|uniref:hypothetical protein n=1 Tax=Shewanella sp. GXUN23E TaxID=3422498 RepID=UPI003D7E1CBB
MKTFIPLLLGISLSGGPMIAPAGAVDVQTIHIKGDEQAFGTTTLKVFQQGVELTESFTSDELKDPDVLANRLASLPEDKRSKIIKLLQSMQNNALLFDVEPPPAMDAAMEERARVFEQQHEQFLQEMEQHARQLEQRSREMELHALKMADQVDLFLPGLEGFNIEISEEGADRLIVVRDDARPAMTRRIVGMIEHSELTEEDKQAIRDALNKSGNNP